MTVKLQNKIFSLTILVVLLLPAVSLAGLRLEQNYPIIPGITDSGQSLNNITQENNNTNKAVNIASLVKYFTDLAFILTVGLATLSLIVAGVQYFSSSGNAGGMRTARTRAGKSFLGIAIIVLSYLILQLIMPQVKVPALTRVGGFEDSNVILFSEEGFEQLYTPNEITPPGQVNQVKLDSIVDQGLAKYAPSQNMDLTTFFGQLIKPEDATSLSFGGFTPQYIGFYGIGKKNIEVKAFSEKGFLGTQTTYTYQGIKGSNGEIIDSSVTSFGVPIDLKVLRLEPYTNPVFYLDAKDSKEFTKSTAIPHPLLSFSVQGIGAGVYLYGSDKPVAVISDDLTSDITTDVDNRDYLEYVGGKGGQRYLQMSYPNFASATFDFDNQAVQIEIKNKKPNDQDPKEQNLLAVLFSDVFYKGRFRIFFEKQAIDFPNVYLENAFKLGGLLNNKAQDLDVIKDTARFFNDTKDIFENKSQEAVGNIKKLDVVSLNPEKIDVNGTDQFGTVNGVSSAGIFKLAPLDDNECREVRICNGIDLNGYCLSFTNNGREEDGFQTFTLPMPWLIPVAIPERLVGALSTGGEALEKDDNDKFADNIHSIGIKGNCAVVLFENSVKMERIKDCIKGKKTKECWDNGNPGVNSQIFTQADMISKAGNMMYLNLDNQPIGSCTKRTWHLSLKRVPCASSIAVFPIK